jgi:hypothetical protein
MVRHYILSRSLQRHLNNLNNNQQCHSKIMLKLTNNPIRCLHKVQLILLITYLTALWATLVLLFKESMSRCNHKLLLHNQLVQVSIFKDNSSNLRELVVLDSINLKCHLVFKTSLAFRCNHKLLLLNQLVQISIFKDNSSNLSMELVVLDSINLKCHPVFKTSLVDLYLDSVFLNLNNHKLKLRFISRSLQEIWLEPKHMPMLMLLNRNLMYSYYQL